MDYSNAPVKGQNPWIVAGFAAFIILMFVSSYLIFFVGQENNITPSENPDGNSTVNATSVPYFSKDINAQIMELFSRVMLIAKTKNARIDEVDSSLYLQGAISVQSRFVGQTGSELDYKAEVQLPGSLSASDFLAKLKEANWTVSQASVMGLAKLENSQVLVNNSDLNMDQNVTLNEIVPGYFSADSQKGDFVHVQVYVNLAGKQVMDSQCFETANVTSNPVSFSVTLQDQWLQEISPQLLLGGTMRLSDNWDKNALESKLKTETGVKDAQVMTSLTKPVVSVIVQKQDENQLSEKLANFAGSDLNAFSFNPGSDENQLSLQVTLNQASAVKKVLQDLNVLLQGFTFSQLQEQIAFFQAQVDLNENQNNKAIVQSIIADLNHFQNGLLINQFMEQGRIFVTQLTSPDTNRVYDVNQLVQVNLLDAFDENETVNVEFVVNIVRDRFDSAQGQTVH